MKVTPTLCEGISPWPTTANLEAWRAPAQPGAQPWQTGGLVWRQQARRSQPSIWQFWFFQPGEGRVHVDEAALVNNFGRTELLLTRFYKAGAPPEPRPNNGMGLGTPTTQTARTAMM